MGTFRTSIPVMQQAAAAISTAKATIDAQLAGIGGTAEATLTGWQGAGGTTLRSLMISYDTHARSLQTAVDTFQAMLSDQATAYGRNDENTGSSLSTAGAALRM